MCSVPSVRRAVRTDPERRADPRRRAGARSRGADHGGGGARTDPTRPRAARDRRTDAIATGSATAAPGPSPPRSPPRRRDGPRQRAGRWPVAEPGEPTDRGGDRRAQRPHRRADARRLRGEVRDPRVRPRSLGPRACARHAGGVPIPATLPSGDPGPNDLSVPVLDADRPPVHPGRHHHVHVGTIGMSRGPSPGHLPADASGGDPPVRVLRGRPAAGRSGPPDLHLRIRDRIPGARRRPDRGPGRDPRASVVRTSGADVPVPADGRDLATVLRPRPRGALARRSLVAPAPGRGAPLAESRASRVGAAVRPRGRASGSADPRRPSRLRVGGTAGPRPLPDPRRRARSGGSAPAGRSPRPHRLPPRDTDGSGRPRARLDRPAHTLRAGDPQLGAGLRRRVWIT